MNAKAARPIETETTDAPRRRLWPIALGLLVFAVVALVVLAWPLGNIADKYGRDYGPGNNRFVLGVAIGGSLLVYFTQLLRRNRNGERTASPEMILACAAGMLAMQVGLWTGVIAHSLPAANVGLPLTVLGLATASRAIVIDWSSLGARGRWLSLASDLYLGSAVVLELARLGIGDLGYSSTGKVPGWAIGLSGSPFWLGLAMFVPLVLALWFIVGDAMRARRSRSKPAA